MPPRLDPAAGAGEPPARESRERRAAVLRGEQRARERAAGEAPPRDPYTGVAVPGVAHRAFAALAENVRDYAVFLMGPEGVGEFVSAAERVSLGVYGEAVPG